MSDRRPLSRRKLLLAVATTGAAASTGSGVAAVMSDSEEVSGILTAGTLDLNPAPSWGNGGSSPGSISGDEGRETVAVSVSGNPSYVWFRTRCKQCTSAEETIRIRFGLDVDGDGTAERWLLEQFQNGGYLSLREARERLGEGILLGDGQLTLGPDDTWELVVEWTTDGPVTADFSVDFDFDFHATQTRHVMNTDSVAPAWECSDLTCDPVGGEDPPAGVKEISFVALCSPDDISSSDVTLGFSDDGTVVTITDVSGDVTIEKVLVKYSTKLDVFAYDGDPSSYATGSAPTTLEQQTGQANQDPSPPQNNDGGYQGSDRTNSTPCLTANGIKYEVGAGWLSEGSDQ